MSAEWKEETLGDLIERGEATLQTGPFGTALKAAEYAKYGVPLISVREIRDGYIAVSPDTPRVTQQTTSRLPKFVLQKGDIVFGRKGGVDRNAIIETNNNGWFLGSDGIRLRLSITVDSVYFSYLVRSPATKSWLLQNCEGTTMPSLNQKVLHRLPVVYPSLDLQKIIGQFLKGIDAKIKINHQINKILEQMAQAIFKSWFVDFEPVKAKIAAKQRWLAMQPGNEPASPVCYAYELTPETPQNDLETTMTLAAMEAISGKDESQLTALQVEQPERYAELHATAELFPSAMQESELGEIPEGWEVSQIGDEVVVVGGGTPSTKRSEFWDDGDIHWTTPKDLSNLADKVLTDTERKITPAGLEKISSGLLPVDTVLMSSRAPVGYLALAKVPLSANQGYIAMKCEKILSPEFVIQWCEAHMDEIKGRASGTTFAEISKKSFKIIPVVVPSNGLVAAFSIRAGPLYALVESKIRESKSLAQLRDTLLPKLLSGELSVSDAESQLTQAESASSAACKAL